jgi:hypothetical protein
VSNFKKNPPKLLYFWVKFFKKKKKKYNSLICCACLLEENSWGYLKAYKFQEDYIFDNFLQYLKFLLVLLVPRKWMAWINFLPRGKKKKRKLIKISTRLFIITTNPLGGGKEVKHTSFFGGIFLILFLVCGDVKKKRKNCSSEVKNDNNFKFIFCKIFIQDFF